jgi:uncharacterized protein YqhQ
MVICIVALLVFSVLSIWSAKYRNLAKQAFRCVLRMVTFRPCDVQLETKIKTKVTAKLMVVPALARFFYKNFKVISWAFTIAFFVSLAYSAYGIYNLVVYGSCNPGGTCVITSVGLCILEVEKILVYVILIVLVIAVAYFLIKRNGKKKSKPAAA